ncbi:purine-nucleoside phosphorylase [Spiroplasma endosymbiont of Lariophagus distinguendus]|uniref:purine-nucleoside phosphorylase n=1 Tax=Spiroplasma endosymbiont of Lariophagus distinguendus TaxID=2935082 RepID=UPI00207A34C7|nr:purine-nucleoside phosphorylase [Spiroplasma endosymbiont of Lariophagus distinguendus]
MENKEKIPTAHIKAACDQIAKVVIMPGDPLRAQFIASNFLQDWKQVNNVRNMLMFTGKYKGYNITIAASGMGMPSIGIYSYELFKFYDVDCIIRVGSAGSYQKDVKVYDIINTTKVYSESTFAKYAANIDKNQIESVGNISKIINKVAQKIDNEFDQQKNENSSYIVSEKINLRSGLIHSSDVFYRINDNDYKTNPLISKCLAVEMESFALFANAKHLEKNAACLLTISDSFITGESISAALRETSFKKMMILALESAVAYYKEEDIDDNLSDRN